jgi:hypothetical protein
MDGYVGEFCDQGKFITAEKLQVFLATNPDTIPSCHVILKAVNALRLAVLRI